MSAAPLKGRDFALVLVVCVAWAVNFLTSALALTEIPPLLFTALRFAALLLPMLFLMRRPPRGQMRRLVVVSLLIGVCHFGLCFIALKLSGQLSSAAILMQSYVPMTVLLSWALLRERVSRSAWLAVAVSFAGVLVLGFDPSVMARPMAMLVMLASAALLALGTVAMKGMQGVDVWTQQGFMAALSVLPLLGLSLWLEPDGFAHLGQAGWRTWLGVGYAAFASSLLGHGLYYRLVQRHPVSQLMPWLQLVPVMAVGLGILAWGDQPGPRLWLGGAMVLGGVLLLAWRQRMTCR